MSAPTIDTYKIIKYLKSLKGNVQVPVNYKNQVEAIDKLLKNDQTGIVSTVYDFMTNTANVPMTIETKNETLDNALNIWQKTLLNKNISIGIPRGLRELSTQYYMERWKSSFVALNVKWEIRDVGDIKGLIVPTKMWFNDGKAITVDAKASDLSKRKYYLGKITDNIELRNTDNTSVIIRKPFDSWYDVLPTPYLVRKGVLANALFKIAIMSKQQDVIQQIIPYLFSIKAGSDKLAELGLLPDEEALKDLKAQFIKAKEEDRFSGSWGEFIGTFHYDVNMEHLIPDLTKILETGNTDAVDKNILAGLGMIEIEGFSKSRQETILNPKMLVEQIKDGVIDWSKLMEEVMHQMKEKNMRKHPKLFGNDLRVVPGKIKAFITEDTKSLIRSLYDRGIISKRTTVEEALDFEFDVEIDRVEKETKTGLDAIMYPPVIQNLQQDTNNNLEDQNKKPGSPEADNFNMSMIKAIKEAIEESELSKEEYIKSKRIEIENARKKYFQNKKETEKE